jgi:uncharacterized membrane protein SpoIIM required for sporulation
VIYTNVSIDLLWWQAFFHIIRNNLFLILLNILGIVSFGIFPIIILFSNGYILSMQFSSYFIYGNLPITTFAKYILPYASIEILAVIISGAIGLHGISNFTKILKGKGNECIFFNKRLCFTAILSVFLTVVSGVYEATILTYFYDVFNVN